MKLISVTVIAFAAASALVATTSCSSDSDASPSSSSTSSSSSGSSSGSTSGNVEDGSAANDAGGDGGGSTCGVRYCCAFDGDLTACTVDNANVKTNVLDPDWVKMDQSVSPPSAMKLTAQGINDSFNNYGLQILPKMGTAKRIEIDFMLRAETAPQAGVFVAKGDSASFALVATGGSLQIIDNALNVVGSIPQGQWTKVTVFVDMSTNTYGAGVPGGVVVTRNMTAPWTSVTELLVGLTKTGGDTTVYYDDVRVDWK